MDRRDTWVEMVFDKVAMPLALLDESQSLVRVNTAFGRLMGAAPDELAGRKLTEFEVREPGQRQADLADAPERFERRYRHADGTVALHEVRVSLLDGGSAGRLLLSQHRLGFAMVWPFIRQLATTPPLLASLAGIVFAIMGWPLPSALDKAFTSLGEMALPLGLLGVGGSLVTVKLHGVWRTPLASALVKTVMSPALGVVVGRFLGLGAAELKMVLIFLASPTAVVSYTMAMELKGDETIASGSIVLSVLTSVAALALIVGLF